MFEAGCITTSGGSRAFGVGWGTAAGGARLGPSGERLFEGVRFQIEVGLG